MNKIKDIIAESLVAVHTHTHTILLNKKIKYERDINLV